MNKLFSKVATLSVGLALAIGVGVAVGSREVKVARADEVVTFTPGTDTGATSVTKSGVTATMTTMNNSSYYQIYANQSGTFTVASGNITKIEFTCTASGKSKYGPGNASANVGTYSYNGKVGTWTGSADSVTISSTAQVRMASLSISYLASSGPSVNITNIPENLLVGGSGTLTASPSGATNPSYTWSSDTPEVLTIDSTSGAYNAVAYGTAKVTVSMTCDEGSASKTATVVVNGASTISVASAVSIAAAFDDSQNTTTAYTVLVKGFVTSFNESPDQSGKYRAINISDSKVASASASDTIMVYGIYSDNALRTYGILDGEVTFRAKVQNYKGTHELSSITLVAYTDAAIEYAATAYASLQTACNTGVEAVTAEQWADLATAFDALDEYAKAKLAAEDVSGYGQDVQNWINRYTIIVENSELSNFMNRGLISGTSAVSRNFGTAEDNTMIIIISIAAVSALAFTTLLVFKKKKQK